MLKEDVSLLSISLPLDKGNPTENMIPLFVGTMLIEIGDPVPGQDIVLVDEDGSPVRWVPFTSFIHAVVQEWQTLSSVYKTLLQAVDNAITIVDSDGKVVAWNPKAEDLYKTSAEEMIGSHITERFKEDAVVLMSTMKEGKGVIRHYNQPQQDVHVLINTLPIFIRDRVAGGISVERDITEIVKLNDELTSTTAYIQDLESQIGSRDHNDPFHKIKGRSQEIKTAISLSKKVANTDATVLITGESGVGKELFAQAIHKASSRSNGPFVDLNCGAIPTALFESELFGYEKGAFTGAIKEGKLGKVGAAKGGTLFLDEIGEMPLELQVKLLRVLQEKQYYRVGGNQPIPIDIRILSATNRDLEKMVEEGLFREDLYYRLNVVTIPIPSLRARKEDLPELVQLFLKEFAIKYRKPIPVIAPEVMVTFMHFPWNGNIRQLRNIIERVMIFADDPIIRPEQLTNEFFKRNTKHESSIHEETESPRQDEKSIIIHTLKETYGNKSAAAKILGLSRVTLYNKMRKYGLL